jgi:hypothetical protein
MDIYQKASRLKIRFATGKGLATVEDLWALPLTKLDEIASDLDGQIEKTGKKSRLATKTTVDEELQVALAVVENVIEVRQLENKAKTEKTQKAAQLATLKDILEKKQMGTLQNLSEEDLMKKIKELEE